MGLHFPLWQALVKKYWAAVNERTLVRPSDVVIRPCCQSFCSVLPGTWFPRASPTFWFNSLPAVFLRLLAHSPRTHIRLTESACWTVALNMRDVSVSLRSVERLKQQSNCLFPDFASVQHGPTSASEGPTASLESLFEHRKKKRKKEKNSENACR